MTGTPLQLAYVTQQLDTMITNGKSYRLLVKMRY